MNLEENLHENNFEDFIKDKIEAFDELPSSDMWNRIEGVIPPKPKPAIVKYVKPISVAASVVLVAALWAAVYQFQSQNAQLSKKLDEASQQIEELNIQVQELNANSEEAMVDQTIIASDDNATTISNKVIEFNQNKKSANFSSITDKTINQSESIQATSTYSPKVQKTIQSMSFAAQINANDDFIQPMAVQEEQRSQSLKENNQTIIANTGSNNNQVDIDLPSEKVIANIAYLKGLDLHELMNNSTPKRAIDVKPLAPNDNATRKADLSNWSITFGVAPLWARSNKRPASGQSLPPSDKRPQEVAEMGQALSFRVNYKLSDHWTISGGLSRMSEIVGLKIKENIPYNRNGELVFDPDFTISNHSYETNSNYGRMGINVDLFRNVSQGDIAEGTPIDLTLKGFYSKKSINIPLVAQYHINPEDRLTFGLKGGVAAQLLLNSEFTPTQVETNEEAILAQGVSLTQPPALSERASIDGIIGAQALYKINDHFQLNVEPTLVWSLTDKHRSPSGKTKSGYGAAQLGLTYLF